MPNIKIGIIGGSGLDDPDILKDKKEKEVTTQYGKPSSSLTIGKISGVDVVILARHGKITFHESFENGSVDTPMATPFNEDLRKKLIETCKELKFKVHEKGTVIT